MAGKWTTIGRVDSCCCIPAIGRICAKCESEGVTAPKDPEPEQKNLVDYGFGNLEGYGYDRADQDGHDGGLVSPIEHKEEEMIEAAKVLLDATIIT